MHGLVDGRVRRGAQAARDCLLYVCAHPRIRGGSTDTAVGGSWVTRLHWQIRGQGLPSRNLYVLPSPRPCATASPLRYACASRCDGAVCSCLCLCACSCSLDDAWTTVHGTCGHVQIA
jgi:hypothetical protein